MVHWFVKLRALRCMRFYVRFIRVRTVARMHFTLYATYRDRERFVGPVRSVVVVAASQSRNEDKLLKLMRTAALCSG